ncbi:unnamed protein product [Symbiodinium natans]|uniref:Glycosyltransferase 2-like domain-containing protein n=1 Tax=Symbiodinium natans TaxID=878477 RepID=A0A812V6F2_9DINO|nr:unnamed protein product [Symbiodinium natans]
MDGKDEKPLYPFYKVNIHEARAAALVARTFPLLVFMTVVGLLIFGVFWNPFILLTVTATLNVAMWLWVVSTAVYCMLGVDATEEELRKKEAGDSSSPVDSESQDNVRHTIVLPNYKEDESILETTLESLGEARGSRGFIVVLAMEAREAEAREKAAKMEVKFKDKFFKMFSTHHPAGLKEEHLDGSEDPELKGKASNVKWAVQQVCKELTISDRDVLTVCDADVIMHPNYFEHISSEFVKLKEDKSHLHTMWQAPQLPWRNFYESPVVSRVWGYISSLWEFGGVSGVLYGAHHMVFSAYSLPLELARDVGCWDGDVIAEDHHAFLKAWFYSAYKMSQSTEEDACPQLVRVKPVMLPAKSTSVNSSESYWKSWEERWQQAKRHAQGVAEVSYAALAAWDMLQNVPVTSFGVQFLWMLFKVVFKPVMMHLVATTQAIALAVLTVYWVARGYQVPWCPDELVVTQLMSSGDTLLCGLAGAWVLTWPIVIPFAMLMVSNYMMLRKCFLTPGEQEKKLIWHKEDGGVVPFDSWWLGPLRGSKSFTLAAVLVFDCVFCLGPIMAVYGVVVEILAYWNVFLRGNHFEYVTASKALDRKSPYGAVECAKAPAALGNEYPDCQPEAEPNESEQTNGS